VVVVVVHPTEPIPPIPPDPVESVESVESVSAKALGAQRGREDRLADTPVYYSDTSIYDDDEVVAIIVV